MPRSALVLLLISIGLSACSKYIPKLDKVLPDKRTEYRKAETMPDLEVPPDLSTDSIQDRMAIPGGGEGATYSTYQERVAKRSRERETAALGDAAVKKLENETVLIVSAAPSLVWPQLREFWKSQGLGLDLDDAELGVMETDWRENSEELTRDRFKVFAETGDDPGETVLYVSHSGEELIPQGESLVWRPRPRDAAAEGAMVNSLRAYLSGTASVASRTSAAGSGSASSRMSAAAGEGGAGDQYVELISAGGGKLYLSMDREFSEAWRVTAQALDVVGAKVEKADKSRGVYQLIYIDPNAPEEPKPKKGMLSRLAFWKKDAVPGQYRLNVTGLGEKTELVLLDADGEWATTEAASRLLVRLHEELNRIL